MLVGQLVQLAVGRGGERQADKIVQIKHGIGHTCAFARHPVCKVAHLLVPIVGTDQVAVVDISVINIAARLHLGLQLFHHVAFADQVMVYLNAGDLIKGFGQHLGFIFVGGQRF